MQVAKRTRKNRYKPVGGSGKPRHRRVPIPVVPVLKGLGAACLLAAGCNTAGQGKNATAPKTEAEVERQQMEIEVEGATATKKGDTITIDYPVLEDKNKGMHPSGKPEKRIKTQ